MTIALTAALLASALASAPEAPKPGTSLTVYSSADPAGFDPQRYVQQQRTSGMDDPWGVPGFGVVKTIRPVQIPAGTGTLAFTDVAAWIDPTTVSFVDLEDPSTTVLEQSFQFDLVSPSKLMGKYLGQQVTVTSAVGEDPVTMTGTLLSATQGKLVLAGAEGVSVVPMDTAHVQLGSLPGGLLTKPTLVWTVAGKAAATHLARTTYQTSGMTWRADYNLVLDGADASADMTAWVTLLNLSGASYPDAELKLVAGNVQRIQPAPMRSRRGMAVEALAMADGAAFEEKEFFEYHLYTLPRRTTVEQNSTQQIALFPPVSGIAVTKELVVDLSNSMGTPPAPITERDIGNAREGRPSVFVSFRNAEDNRMGMPLPAGKVRVYKMDPDDGTLEFVGEDLINHTPRNETVKVRLGEAFDVVAERTRTDFSVDRAARKMSETFRLEVRNRKQRAERIRVIDRPFRWTTWDVAANSHPFTKVDAGTIAFDLDVPADGTTTVTWTFTYTW
jgi:hypothetical protein